MIVERPPILLVLDAGHGEYMPAQNTVIFNPLADEWDALMMPGVNIDERIMAGAARGELAKIGADTLDFAPYDWTFCTIITVDGTLAELELQLTALIGEIGVEPSGDDDTFDYWPSGCRLALAFAQDLDQIAPLPGTRLRHVRATINEVLAGMPEFANELTDKIVGGATNPGL